MMQNPAVEAAWIFKYFSAGKELVQLLYFIFKDKEPERLNDLSKVM